MLRPAGRRRDAKDHLQEPCRLLPQQERLPANIAGKMPLITNGTARSVNGGVVLVEERHCHRRR